MRRSELAITLRSFSRPDTLELRCPPSEVLGPQIAFVVLRERVLPGYPCLLIYQSGRRLSRRQSNFRRTVSPVLPTACEPLAAVKTGLVLKPPSLAALGLLGESVINLTYPTLLNPVFNFLINLPLSYHLSLLSRSQPIKGRV
jgi:hypothetical protein